MLDCAPLTSSVDAGKTLSVSLEAQNNMAASSSSAKYTAAIESLGIRDSQTTQGIPAGETGESTLRLRIPECTAAGVYKLLCSSTNAGHTATTSTNVRINAGVCKPAQQDASAVIYQMQDVVAGNERGSSYPITITNTDTKQRTYLLSADGILPWGDYVFEDGSAVVVPAGDSVSTNLRVFAQSRTQPGVYPFKITMQSGDEKTDAYLRANVVPTDTSTLSSNSVRVTDLVWFGIILIVLGLIIYGMYQANKRRK
jgi:uncharacterized membrane protein